MGVHRDDKGAEIFSRPVYPYPDIARYEGNKEKTSPEGFKRQAPRRE